MRTPITEPVIEDRNLWAGQIALPLPFQL